MTIESAIARSSALGGESGDDRLTDFDRRKGKVPEHREGRRPHPEVIDRQSHAEPGELAERTVDAVVRKNRLWHLQLEVAGFDVRRTDGIRDIGNETRIAKLRRRQVDRHHEQRLFGELFVPDAELPTRLAKHPPTKSNDLAGGLRCGDELCWL